MSELDLLAAADSRARHYVAGNDARRVFPTPQSVADLAHFDEVLPESGKDPLQTLELLDRYGSPATVASNGSNYYGFVIGASLPVAAAAERLALAWDQCASSALNSPAAAKIEEVAGRWVLEALDLPRESAVTFGTSASACGLACLIAARRALLERQGWDFDRRGLHGAPQINVVLSASAHITVLKALRLMGIGLDNLIRVPVDENARMDPAQLPELDDKTILILQAGEVNTGEFDCFGELIAKARAAGTWVHVDGAFGLWARTSDKYRHLTTGIENADSWTADGHKWLNTPYDGAFGICRHPDLLAAAMNSDAVYASTSADSQKNLGIEFSRRARGIPIWAALRSLGRAGVAQLVEQNCTQAQRLAQGLRDAGFEVLNRVVLNQVLVRLDNDQNTELLRERANASGKIWFGPSVYQGRVAFRLSVSSFRTRNSDIDNAIALLTAIREELMTRAE